MHIRKLNELAALDCCFHVSFRNKVVVDLAAAAVVERNVAGVWAGG